MIVDAKTVAEEVVRLLEERRPPGPWLTMNEAAQYLRVSRRWLELRIAEGAVTAHRIENRVLLNRDELDRWVESH